MRGQPAPGSHAAEPAAGMRGEPAPGRHGGGAGTPTSPRAILRPASRAHGTLARMPKSFWMLLLGFLTFSQLARGRSPGGPRVEVALGYVLDHAIRYQVPDRLAGRDAVAALAA